MDGLAVIGAVFFLIVVGYVGVSAVLRRIPATSLRLPTGPIPDTWDGIVEHNVPLARSLSSDERDRLLRLVQVFLAEKHFEGCGGLTLTEEMKVTIAAGACLLLLHLEGPCYPTLWTSTGRPIRPSSSPSRQSRSSRNRSSSSASIPHCTGSYGSSTGRIRRVERRPSTHETDPADRCEPHDRGWDGHLPRSPRARDQRLAVARRV